jgi:uncharacterized protein Yka (UPF0111/DUF47 family)
MRLSLIPRDLPFFDLFDEAAHHLVQATDKFVALLSMFDRLGERCYEIRQVVHACDEVVQRLIETAERNFVTPFDRENILDLAQSINDLMDAIEEAASRFEVFHIDRPTNEAILMARILADCCHHAADGVRLCRDLKNAEQVQRNAREIVRLEKEVDRVRRDCDSALFAHPEDPIELIKWRELYGAIKDAVNAARRVGQALSEIVIKGA